MHSRPISKVSVPVMCRETVTSMMMVVGLSREIERDWSVWAALERSEDVSPTRYPPLLALA